MRIRLAIVVVLLLGACGPETVRATGAPGTTRPAVPILATSSIPTATATAVRTPAANTTPIATATTTPKATATASATPTAAGNPVLGACASESSLRSQPASTTVPLLVSNNAGARRDLSSLDAIGRRVFAKALAAGESYTQTARIGEVWVVTEPGGGCVAVYPVVAPALLIVSATRNTLLPLYAIRGRVTDARSGGALPGQTVFIWNPDESSCAIIGGSGAPGYVVSAITATDGTYGVFVTAGDYKVRVRTAPVGSVTYAPQWWRGKPATTAGQCAAADVITMNADLIAIDFVLQPE